MLLNKRRKLGLENPGWTADVDAEVGGTEHCPVCSRQQRHAHAIRSDLEQPQARADGSLQFNTGGRIGQDIA